VTQEFHWVITGDSPLHLDCERQIKRFRLFRATSCPSPIFQMDSEVSHFDISHKTQLKVFHAVAPSPLHINRWPSNSVPNYVIENCHINWMLNNLNLFMFGKCSWCKHKTNKVRVTVDSKRHRWTIPHRWRLPKAHLLHASPSSLCFLECLRCQLIQTYHRCN
jgi:hypothetical protein